MKDKHFAREMEQHENMLSRSRNQAQQKKWQLHSTVLTLSELVGAHGRLGLQLHAERAHTPLPLVEPRTPCTNILA